MSLHKNLTKILALIFLATPYSFQTLLAAKNLVLHTMTREQIRALKNTSVSSINTSETFKKALIENNIDTLGQLSQFFKTYLQLSQDIKIIKAQIYCFLKDVFLIENLTFTKEDNFENLEHSTLLSLYGEALPYLDQTEKDLYGELVIEYQQTLQQVSFSDFDILSQYSADLEDIKIHGINLKNIMSLGDLDELDIPLKIYDQLTIRNNIYHISTLCNYAENDIFYGIGEHGLGLIKEALSKMNLSLRPRYGLELIELGLPTQICTVLLNKKIDSISKLSSYTEDDLMKIKGLGPNTINIIKIALKAKGVSLREK